MMKTLLAIACALLAAVDVAGQSILLLAGRTPGAASDPLLPYLVAETFDATGSPGYDLTWTESGTGTIDENATTATSPQGGQCLEINSSGTQDNAYVAFTAQTTCYVTFLWRYQENAGSADLANFRSTASQRMRVITSATGALTIQNGSATAVVSDSVPQTTWVYLRCKYVAGSGSNGYADLEWDDGSPPVFEGDTGSNTRFAKVTTGTATSSVNRFYLGSAATETIWELFDDVRIDEAGYPQP